MEEKRRQAAALPKGWRKAQAAEERPALEGSRYEGKRKPPV